MKATCCSKTCGVHGIQLSSYVVRVGDVGDYFGDYETETIMDKLVARVAHEGMQYSTNNKHLSTIAPSYATKPTPHQRRSQLLW